MGQERDLRSEQDSTARYLFVGRNHEGILDVNDGRRGVPLQQRLVMVHHHVENVDRGVEHGKLQQVEGVVLEATAQTELNRHVDHVEEVHVVVTELQGSPDHVERVVLGRKVLNEVFLSADQVAQLREGIRSGGRDVTARDVHIVVAVRAVGLDARVLRNRKAAQIDLAEHRREAGEVLSQQLKL